MENFCGDVLFMIKNYIFDFGNVLAEFYPDKLTAPYAEDEKIRKTISDVIFDRFYWDRLDNGTISNEDIKKEAKDRLSPELYESACMAIDNWIVNLTPVAGMQQLIDDIKKTDKKLYLLSNISIEFAQGYKNVPWIKELFDKFDGLVFSGPIGLVKPKKEIFDYLTEKYQLKNEECLFIDDSCKNINGAKDCAIEGYLFDGDAEKLREYLGL